MTLRIGCVLVGFLSLVLSMAAQTSGSSPASAQVPPLIQFSGVAKGATGKPMTGVVGITFSLYQDQQGGAPLWMETQNVQPDANGHYIVLLGSTKSTGVPAELFASREAQWLGVQLQGEAEQARVLMVSVPYALKALDAETVGGKPASAFMAAPNFSALGTGGAAVANGAAAPSSAPTLSGAGKKNYLPLWLSSSKLGSSKLFQSLAGNVGIGTTTPAATLDVNGTGDIRDTLTLFPKSSDPSLSVSGTAFSVSNTGLVSFVSGQSFPGAGTVTSVGSGLGLTGGPITTSGTLKIDTTVVPQLNTANTFTGNQTVNGNLSATGAVSGSSFQIGSNLFAFGSYGNENAFLGFAGNSTMTGGANTATGYLALSSNTTGNVNTASGVEALEYNTTGSNNTASGVGALGFNTIGTDNTASGFAAASTTPRALTTPPAASRRCTSTPPAATTPPLALKRSTTTRTPTTPPTDTRRSTPTPPAASTPPAAWMRSTATPRAKGTPPSVSRRSTQTPRATISRAWVSVALCQARTSATLPPSALMPWLT
jgi:hypothetical protein